MSLSLVCVVLYLSVVVQGTPAFCKYNIIVLNNADLSQDIEGELFVGGNVNSRYATLAMKLENTFPKFSPSVTVAGDFNGGANINAGSIVIGGSLVQKPGEKLFMNSQGTILTGAKSHLEKTSINNEILALSDFYRKLPSNGGTISTPDPNGHPQGVNIAVHGEGRVVLNVEGTRLFSNSKVQQIGFSIGRGVTSVIVNVKGTSINFDSGNFVGDVTKVRTHVIWNFYEALTLDTGNKIFEGSVLAPLASLSNGSPIEGSVAVSSYTQGGEIHLPKTVVCDEVQPLITPSAPTTTTYDSNSHWNRAQQEESHWNRERNDESSDPNQGRPREGVSGRTPSPSPSQNQAHLPSPSPKQNQGHEDGSNKNRVPVDVPSPSPSPSSNQNKAAPKGGSSSSWNNAQFGSGWNQVSKDSPKKGVKG